MMTSIETLRPVVFRRHAAIHGQTPGQTPVSRGKSDRPDGGTRVASGCVADAHFENPRLAMLYDPLDPDRQDLDVYAAMAAEFGARDVLDIGCGTGALACLLATAAAIP